MMNLYSQLEFEYLSECPICGALEDTWEALTGEVTSHGYYIIYRRCSVCHVVFQNPRPTEESVISAYTLNQYREVVTGVDEGTTKREVNLQALRAQRIASIMEAEKIKPSRFLDVGSSLGILVYQIKMYADCDAWGQELSHKYRELASGLEGVNTVETLEDLEGKFDVITSIHVLEHLSDPLGQLKKLRELLTDDGILILECPDGQVTSGMSIWHNFIFVQLTTRDLLKRAGFEGAMVDSMHKQYFNTEEKRRIPSMVVIAPKNGPYTPPIPQKPLTD